MSEYGLFVSGADSIYQLDSRDVSTFHLGISHEGSTTTIGPGSGAGEIAAWEDGDFVFVKPKGNNSSYQNVRFLNSGGTLKFYSHVDYFICKVAKNNNFADQSGVNYGIEVKNDNGDYIFTSQKINKGMEVIVIKDEGSCAGGGSLVGPPATNNIMYQAPSGQNLNNIYFGSASSQSSASGIATSTVESSGEVFGGCWYDYTNNRILFQQWMDLAYFPIYGSNFEAFPNGGKLIVGELHE